MTTMPPVNFNRLFCHKFWLGFLTVLYIGWWHGHVDNCCNGVQGKKLRVCFCEYTLHSNVLIG